MDPLLIITFVILFLLSAFFSASEIALMSLPHHKIDSLVKQNKFGSKSLKYIRDRNDKLLITILIWNNLVNVYIASLATQMAISIASTSSYEAGLVVWLSTWIITFLLLMFGEIVPKSYATKNAELIGRMVSLIYKFLIIILTPVLFIIEIIIKLTTWKTTVPQLTDEEVEAFIDMWKESWVFEASEHEKIKNMLEFADITVEEIITPRVNIDALSLDTTVEEAIEFILEKTHSRIPVYNSTIDNIEYIVNLRFLLWEKRKWNGSKYLSELKNLDKAIKIPLNNPIDKLLEIFRNSRKHMAIVIDEYGWVAWLVTLEDIIEEVFWDIKDEYDRETEEIVKIWEGKLLVESSVLFEDVLEELSLTFEELWLEEKDYYATTISYFITEELWRFPNPWEIIKKDITFNDSETDDDNNSFLEFKIKSVSDWKIEAIEVWIKSK